MCRSILLFSLQLPGNSTDEMYCLINITQKRDIKEKHKHFIIITDNTNDML